MVDAPVVKPRVIVADDSLEMIQLIVRVLGAKVHLLATTQNGREAASLALDLEPDILILDQLLPVLDGLEVATVLEQHKAKTKLIFLTSFDHPDFFHAALRSGGRGFVAKSQIHMHLPRAIGVVMEGWTFFSSEEPS